MERAQRTVSRRKKGGKRRRRAVKALAKRYARVANLRRETAITVTRTLVAKYDVICVEKLNRAGLARSRLAKPIHDAGWGVFLHWLRVKAESAGREVVEVDPAGTTKTCSACGAVGPPLPLSVRTFRCDACGFTADRDVNAAINIKGAGMLPRGAAPLVRGRLRSEKSNRHSP